MGTLALLKHVPMRALVSSGPSTLWPAGHQAVCRATASLRQKHTHARRHVRQPGSLSLSTAASPSPGQEVGMVSDRVTRSLLAVLEETGCSTANDTHPSAV